MIFGFATDGICGDFMATRVTQPVSHIPLTIEESYIRNTNYG